MVNSQVKGQVTYTNSSLCDISEVYTFLLD